MVIILGFCLLVMKWKLYMYSIINSIIGKFVGVVYIWMVVFFGFYL